MARRGDFFALARAGSKGWTARFSRSSVGIGRSWSCRTPCWTQHRPSFEIHGEAKKTQMRLVACQAEITDARPAVDALEAREDLLDRRAAPSYGVVEALLPLGQGMMLVGPEHQPRFDAPGSQTGAAIVLVIGL